MDFPINPNCRWHSAGDSPLVFGIRTERNLMAKYDNVTVNLSGTDGNAFAVMATVKSALEKGGAPQDEIEQYLAESMSGDYDNLLRTAMKWVHVS
jgi:hypothetical protein